MDPSPDLPLTVDVAEVTGGCRQSDLLAALESPSAFTE
jgi:hypothetical protein